MIATSNTCVFSACVSWSLKVNGIDNIPLGDSKCPMKLVKCHVGCLSLIFICSGNFEKEWSYMISVVLPLSLYILWTPMSCMRLYMSTGLCSFQLVMCLVCVLNILCMHMVVFFSSHAINWFLPGWVITMLHTFYYCSSLLLFGCLRHILLRLLP